MKISMITLPTNHYLATGERLNDFAQWKVDEPLRDSDFFVGASSTFKTELRKHLKKSAKRIGSQVIAKE
jgi:hypothetical protein